MNAADMQYTATIFLTFFSMLIMILMVQYNDLLEGKKKWELTLAFVFVIIAAAAEWISNSINGRLESWRIIHILSKATDHTLAPVISMIFTGIMTNEKTAKKLLIPLIIHGILEFASGWLGFIYIIDAQNVYHHGPAYGIYVAFYLFCTAYFLLAAWRFGNRYQTGNRVILELILAFLVTGLFSSMIWSGIRVSYICLHTNGLTFLRGDIIMVLSKQQVSTLYILLYLLATTTSRRASSVNISVNILQNLESHGQT